MPFEPTIFPRALRQRVARTTLLAVLLAAVPATGFAQQYTQLPGSTLVFASTYEGEAFTGRFPGFVTRLTFDPAHLDAARLDVTIPLATASTGNSDYDGEIRGAGFFDVARFPQARYTAEKFRALGGDRYAADGTLSLRGVSKPVTLVFTWSGGPRPVLSGKATVKRLQFGVGGGEWADTELLPDEVAVSTKVLLAPAKAAVTPPAK